MEFGKVSHTELEKIDFTLPPDPVSNEKVLDWKRKGKVYIGLTQWGRTEWLGTLYPHKLKPGDFLHHYVHHFNCVELNATHYTWYGPARISSWAHTARDRDFKFCPKMHKEITHGGPLAPRDLLVEKFAEDVRHFGEHLGPIWAQLPDRYDFKKKNDLYHFFDSIPSAMTFFLEVRHPSWFEQPGLFDELRTRKFGAIITDTSGARFTNHMNLTIPKTFIRFVTNNLHPSDFERTDIWARRINEWLDKGIEEVYFFIHVADEHNTVDIAQYVIQKFNEVCKLEIPPLQMIS
jgi:uncharacterized protein YecE (DUF72 family)